MSASHNAQILIKEMQIKAKMKHQYTHTRIVKIIRLLISSFSKEMEPLELSNINGVNVKFIPV